MNTNKSLVFLFDVDNTLLNNDLIKEQIKASLIKVLGETEAMDFWWHHDEFRSYQKLVDFPAITKAYCMEKNVDSCEMTVGTVFSGINFVDALFPKSIEVLDYLKNLGSVNLFSEGDMVYQKTKIQKSGLSSKVNNIFLYEHKLDHLPEVMAKFKDAQLIFIDDRDDKLMGVKKQHPEVITIVVCQGHYAGPKCPMEHTADRVIGTISEMLQVKKEDF